VIITVENTVNEAWVQKPAQFLSSTHLPERCREKWKTTNTADLKFLWW